MVLWRLVRGQGGVGLTSQDTMTQPNPVLGQVVSHSGSPPVHVCVRMTRDAANHVIEYTPATSYQQCLNPHAVPWPDGALVELYEIEDWVGWYWGEPVIQYADTSSVQLTQDGATDIVTAVAVTQLSITKDGGGLKLVNDSDPPANRYYGTAPGGASLGYQDLPAAVVAAAGTSTFLTAVELGLFGVLPQNGLTLIAGGGGVFFVGLDLVVASTVPEVLVNDSILSVDDEAVLTTTNFRTVYLNDFNAQGLIINRRVGLALNDDYSVSFVGGPGISVVGDSGDDTITISAEVTDSITISTGGMAFVNDNLAPGASYLYSTDASGTKGWHVTDGTWLDMVGAVLSHVGPSSVGTTTYTWPRSITVDLHGHVYAATGGGAPVTSISTTNASGGPLTGDVTFNGGANITLSVSGNVVTINGSGGNVGPSPVRTGLTNRDAR